MLLSDDELEGEPDPQTQNDVQEFSLFMQPMDVSKT